MHLYPKMGERGLKEMKRKIEKRMVEIRKELQKVHLVPLDEIDTDLDFETVLFMLDMYAYDMDVFDE
ncbi:hypothetical protein HDV04_003293 [Boothiomyces sp. JEL0838]|nr:hypothetical protein HDV04_003271 [Boothiomyces sp. JEL0838]KAJ3312272.1 hypothetical protein HDV04_003293 [Boothiomyces sp. JEL0838]